MADARLTLVGSLALLFAVACTGRATPPHPDMGRAAESVAPRAPAGCRRAEPHAHVEPRDTGTAGAGSAIALAQARGELFAYVADRDRQLVRTIDVDRAQEVAVTPLDG